MSTLPSSLPDLPNERSNISIFIYDQWIKHLRINETELTINLENISTQQSVIEAATSQLEQVQKNIRQISAELPTTETDQKLALAKQGAQTAKLWLRLCKQEEKLLQTKNERLLHAQQRLKNTLDIIKNNTQFTEQHFEEQIANLDFQAEKLKEKAMKSAVSTETARSKWLKVQRKIGANEATNKFTEELDAKYQILQTQILEDEIFQFGLDRIDIEKFIWQVRFLLWTNKNTEELLNSDGKLAAHQLLLEKQRKSLNQKYETITSRYTRLNHEIEHQDVKPTKWQLEQREYLNKSMSLISFEKNNIGESLALLGQVSMELTETLNQVSFEELWERLSYFADKFWNAEVFVFEDKAITLGKLVVGIFLLLTGIWIARLFTRLIGSWLLSRLRLDESIIAVIQTILFYILLITVVLFALKLINIPLTVFTVLGGALAIGIGFGSQNLMSNFISGLILLAERPIRVGDFIQIGNLIGVITHIGARSTSIKTPQNVDIIVPNSNLLEDQVTNWTLSDTKVRTSITVGVAYGSNVELVAELLKKAASEHKRVLNQPAPVVLFKDFGDNSLTFELLIWVNMRRLIERLTIESDLRFTIDKLFREANISIAFPQRDIHLDTLKPLEVKMIQ